MLDQAAISDIQFTSLFAIIGIYGTIAGSLIACIWMYVKDYRDEYKNK